MGWLTCIIARIADVGGFDEQRTDSYIRIGKVLSLFDPVASKFHYLFGEMIQQYKHYKRTYSILVIRYCPLRTMGLYEGKKKKKQFN